MGIGIYKDINTTTTTCIYNTNASASASGLTLSNHGGRQLLESRCLSVCEGLLLQLGCDRVRMVEEIGERKERGGEIRRKKEKKEKGKQKVKTGSRERDSSKTHERERRKKKKKTKRKR